MLFGESTTEKTALSLLSMAAERGVTLFDSAEMYPVPQRAATQGASERLLGKWLHTQPRWAPTAYSMATCCSSHRQVLQTVFAAGTRYWLRPKRQGQARCTGCVAVRVHWMARTSLMPWMLACGDWALIILTCTSCTGPTGDAVC